MITRQPWIEHTFNLDIDPGWWPNILTRLEDFHLRVKHHCSSLAEDQLSLQLDRKWSIKQHLGHLIDLEELHTDRLVQLSQLVSVLKPADMSNKQTEIADHNTRTFTSLLDQFIKVRLEFITMFKSLEDNIHFHSALHERTQLQMKPVDVLFFVAEHDDHHLASILQIKNQLIN